MAIDYTDGAGVEAEVLEILSQSGSLGALEAPGADRYDASWPLHYHLTPERSNLLRHLDFTGLDVLELGAAMGGVSRYLAEHARSLHAVEGNEERYAALASRLRDRPNWTGRVGNISEIDLDRKFDVVCVIGVLEYAELYVTPPDGHTPFSWFLAKAAGALREGGVLLLAIENRVGLKYWNAAAEDHTGRLYDGITGYPPSPTPRTFSRRELDMLLARAGLTTREHYAAFPDYKLPVSLLSDRFLQQHPEAAGALAASRPWENYDQPRVRQFPETLAAESIGRAGLLGDLANSFLVLASTKPSSPTLQRLTRAERENGELAWSYACRRRVPTRTVFRETADGTVATTESLRDPNTPTERFHEGDLAIRWNAILGERIGTGEPLRLRFARRAYYGDGPAALALADDFLAWSFLRWNHDSKNLDGNALDAVLTNATLTADGPERYTLFELHWRLEGPMLKSWFVLRNVLSLLAERDLFPRAAPFRSPRELYDALCAKRALKPNFAADLAREARLQALVSDRPSALHHRAALDTLVAKPISGALHPRYPTDEERSFLAMLHTTPLKVLGQLSKAVRGSPWLKAGAKSAFRLIRAPL